MAKFLATTGVSYHLEELINKADERLILISPFLKINDRIKQKLEDKDRMKIDIRVVYGKNELQPDENNWLRSMASIRSSFCKDLHAKCYMNEKEAIITSMNLYEFSQVNNNEMGVYVSKQDDPDLYKDIYDEAQRLLRISDEIVVSVKKAPKEELPRPEFKKIDKKVANANEKHIGYCIRTGTKIDFNPERPFSYDAFKQWNKYGDLYYPEKFCHYSGESSNGETCMDKPIMHKNWKKAMAYLDELDF